MSASGRLALAAGVPQALAGSGRAAQALRRAEIELLRGDAGAELTAPAVWAAFELIGDWR